MDVLESRTEDTVSWWWNSNPIKGVLGMYAKVILGLGLSCQNAELNGTRDWNMQWKLELNRNTRTFRNLT